MKKPEDSSRMKKREKFIIGLLIVLSLATVSTMIFATKYYASMSVAINDVKSTQQVQYSGQIETRQFLLSTINWETKRQKTILFMRDMIIDEWERCGFDIDYNKAYLIAESNMVESEKYPHIDPILLLAMQWKESSFIDTAVSHMGAQGLMQIMPATGRLLAGFFHVQYSDNMLMNYNTSVKFGTKYMDVLYAQYEKTEYALAAYNGGFWSAYYYKTGNDKLAEETANYVPSIMDKIKEYKEIYQTYKIDEKMSIK